MKKTPGKCPFDHTKLMNGAMGRLYPPHVQPPYAEPEPHEATSQPSPTKTQPFTPAYQQPAYKHAAAAPLPQQHLHQQPTFLNPEPALAAGHNGPQMLFTGPVFIGYPIDQAIQFMQHFQGNR